MFDACEVTHSLVCLGGGNSNIILKISGATVQTLAAGDLCNPSVMYVCMYVCMRACLYVRIYVFINVFLTQGCRELEVGPMLTDADAP